MKGYVYKITNETLNINYIGSTHQVNPKQRLYRHRWIAKQPATCQRYGELFKNKCSWDIIWEGFVNTEQELKRLEQVFMDIHQCINKNCAHIHPNEYADKRKQYKKKYNATEKGKVSKKWQTYRAKSRNKINKEIKIKIKKII